MNLIIAVGRCWPLPSYKPSVTRESTLYISLDMPPDLETKPMEPGRCSLQVTMLSSVPAVSPILKAPACTAHVASVCSVGCSPSPHRPCLLSMQQYIHIKQNVQCFGSRDYERGLAPTCLVGHQFLLQLRFMCRTNSMGSKRIYS